MQLLSKMDLKTILIIILGAALAYFIIFQNPSSKLDALKETHDKEIKLLREDNARKDRQIASFDKIIQDNKKAFEEKDKIIAEFIEEKQADEKEIARLKKERKQIDEQFGNISESELLIWMQEFFKRHEE